MSQGGLNFHDMPHSRGGCRAGEEPIALPTIGVDPMQGDSRTHLRDIGCVLALATDR
jgi:hypothetical protein